MYYGGLYNFDTLNGEGFRVSLFISGCDRKPKCRNCQNKKAWNHCYGIEFTEETKEDVIEKLSSPYIDGLSLLGGEPSDNLKDGVLFSLLDEIRLKMPSKTIWCWSGYLFEDMLKDPLKLKLMQYIDVLIDGEFIPELKNLNKPYGNSENQRVIMCKKSIKENKLIFIGG